MNSNSYGYSVTVAADPFSELAALFDSELVNNTIKISDKKGKGIIKKVDAAEGLRISLWDIQLDQTVQFDKVPEHTTGKRSFSLFYIFTHDYFLINATDRPITPDQPSKNILFASSEVNLAFQIKPYNQVRVIQIDITEEWLASEYPDNSQSTHSFFHDLINKRDPIFFTRPASFTAYHAFLNIYTHVNAEHPDSFYIKAKTLSLLSDIFISPSKQSAASENNLLLHEKMIAVEKILDEHLDKTLPSIGSIARQMALSESTLKRNFKLLYGTSIYEYYLRKKMQKARQLFSERSIPVKEVAYMLGYEKVSNFIHMFKKHYNFSPGRLKKSPSLLKENSV